MDEFRYASRNKITSKTTHGNQLIMKLPPQFLFDIKYKIRFFMTSSPEYFPIWRKIRSKSYPHTVNKQTDITIEGFPRSGNTFAVAAFEFSQNKELTIAHHTHSAAQVIESVKLNIPTLLLVRFPKDAIISLVIRENISITTAIKSYVNYYENLYKYRDKVYLVSFEKLTTDFGEIITAVNKKFGTCFVPFMHHAENLKKVFSIVDEMELKFSGSLDETQVARPSKHRKLLKKTIEKLYITQAGAWEQRAEDIYNLLVKEN